MYINHIPNKAFANISNSFATQSKHMPQSDFQQQQQRQHKCPLLSINYHTFGASCCSIRFVIKENRKLNSSIVTFATLIALHTISRAHTLERARISRLHYVLYSIPNTYQMICFENCQRQLQLILLVNSILTRSPVISKKKPLSNAVSIASSFSLFLLLVYSPQCK